MILVSFSSAEDALSNDVKKYTTFRMQGTENPPFRFFLGHPVYLQTKDTAFSLLKTFVFAITHNPHRPQAEYTRD